MRRQRLAFSPEDERCDVLCDTERTDDGAVEASEQERDEEDDDACDQCADGERGDGFHQRRRCLDFQQCSGLRQQTDERQADENEYDGGDADADSSRHIVLFFHGSEGRRGQEGERIAGDVPQDEKEEENGGDGERERLVVLEFWISPNQQRADDAWKQDRIATQCFERMSMEQGMDGSRAAAARAVHARHLMEGAFWHESLDGVARLHGVNSRQRRDQQDRGGYGEYCQLFT